jgi:hypothetical protein
MVAEIFKHDIRNDSPDDVRGQLLEEEGSFHWEEGHGDGTGYETCVRVKDGRVEVFSAEITEDFGTDKGRQISIKAMGPIHVVEEGEPHIEELIGPANNNRVQLHVRKVGGTAVQPTLN